MTKGRPRKGAEFGEGWFERTESSYQKNKNKLDKMSEEMEPTEEEQQVSQEAIEEATRETIDWSRIGDVTYLQDIFNTKYDTYGSLGYLEKLKERMAKLHYPETPLFNTMLFLATILRRLQIVYQEHHVALKEKFHQARPEDLELLRQIQDVSRLLGELQKSMDLAILRQKQVEDVFSLHDETMKLAERDIEAHAGEHTFMCQQCGSVVDTQGLEHWAIRTTVRPGDSPIYHVFSPEMWELVRMGVMPIYVMAFCLRTSIEWVLITAKVRKEAWLPHLDEKQLEAEEKKLMELKKPYDDQLEKSQRSFNESLRA